MTKKNQSQVHLTLTQCSFHCVCLPCDCDLSQDSGGQVLALIQISEHCAVTTPHFNLPSCVAQALIEHQMRVLFTLKAERDRGRDRQTQGKWILLTVTVVKAFHVQKFCIHRCKQSLIENILKNNYAKFT